MGFYFCVCLPLISSVNGATVLDPYLSLPACVPPRMCPSPNVSLPSFVPPRMCPSPHLPLFSFVPPLIYPSPHVSLPSFAPPLICPSPHLSLPSFVPPLICPSPYLSLLSFVSAPISIPSLCLSPSHVPPLLISLLSSYLFPLVSYHLVYDLAGLFKLRVAEGNNTKNSFFQFHPF